MNCCCISQTLRKAVWLVSGNVRFMGCIESLTFRCLQNMGSWGCLNLFLLHLLLPVCPPFGTPALGNPPLSPLCALSPPPWWAWSPTPRSSWSLKGPSSECHPLTSPVGGDSAGLGSSGLHFRPDESEPGICILTSFLAASSASGCWEALGLWSQRLLRTSFLSPHFLSIPL